jgi:hypothetical protein
MNVHASMHHLSSPETRRCFRADYGENNSDAAAFMLYQMGQAILLFGTGYEIPRCPEM